MLSFQYSPRVGFLCHLFLKGWFFSPLMILLISVSWMLISHWPMSVATNSVYSLMVLKSECLKIIQVAFEMQISRLLIQIWIPDIWQTLGICNPLGPSVIPVSVVTRYHYGVTVVATPKPGGLDWDGSVLLSSYVILGSLLKLSESQFLF